MKDDIAEGHLQAVLSDYANPENSVNVVYQGSKTMPKRVRALIDALIAAFSQA